MDYEKALRIINNEYLPRLEGERFRAMEAASVAIEKQIPVSKEKAERSSQFRGQFERFACPTCKVKLNSPGQKFCQNCGQALAPIARKR